MIDLKRLHRAFGSVPPQRIQTPLRQDWLTVLIDRDTAIHAALETYEELAEADDMDRAFQACKDFCRVLMQRAKFPTLTNDECSSINNIICADILSYHNEPSGYVGGICRVFNSVVPDKVRAWLATKPLP